MSTFEYYFIERNGLWAERLVEVERMGFEKASPIARLIYECERGAINQHASEDLKMISAFIAVHQHPADCVCSTCADDSLRANIAAIGGFDLALEHAGVEVQGVCEIAQPCGHPISSNVYGGLTAFCGACADEARYHGQAGAV